jgi:5-methylcytosine-specific restriction endonuclease McrA
MADAVRRAVAARAASRCEYCRLHSDDDAFAFHVEHVIAIKHGGSSALENLAFACQHCNLHKGSNLSGIDPDTGAVTSLFHPRQQVWDDHFAFSDHRIQGRTATGRATVQVLAMNDPDRVKLRMMLGPSKS